MDEKEKIDRLVDMQSHCGMAGVALTGVWLALIHNLSSVDIFKLSSISLWFFGILVAGFFFPLYVLRNIVKSQDATKARNWLRFSSVVCIFLISALIWASGGSNSPFIAFYIMTFTLTLSQIKSENFELKSLGAFLIPLIFVFFLSYESFYGGDHTLLSPMIPVDAMKVLLVQPFHFILLALGACFSMVIPTASLMRIKSKRASGQRDG